MNLTDRINESFKSSLLIQQGEPASYIPELAKVPPDLFSISLCDLKGQVISQGDAETCFTLQSISKVLAYALVLENFSEAEVAKKVGVEPSGEEFDSIIKLDRYKRPFNPMVNAGAIAITDLILSRYGKDALGQSLSFFANLFGKSEVRINESVFQSELETGERNRALAHLLRSFEILDNPVEDVLELYFKHCSVEINTQDLSKLGATLARKGCTPEGQPRVSPTSLRKLLSVMLSCGMYNYAGQWIYEVGLPAKSGISGGILAVVPDQFGIAVFSPRINKDGCSYRGAAAIKDLGQKLKLHIFDC